MKKDIVVSSTLTVLVDKLSNEKGTITKDSIIMIYHSHHKIDQIQQSSVNAKDTRVPFVSGLKQ